MEGAIRVVVLVSLLVSAVSVGIVCVAGAVYVVRCVYLAVIG